MKFQYIIILSFIVFHSATNAQTTMQTTNLPKITQTSDGFVISKSVKFNEIIPVVTGFNVFSKINVDIMRLIMQDQINPNFCTKQGYLQKYPDVANHSYWKNYPVEHWHQYGSQLGRCAPYLNLKEYPMPAFTLSKTLNNFPITVGPTKQFYPNIMSPATVAANQVSIGYTDKKGAKTISLPLYKTIAQKPLRIPASEFVGESNATYDSTDHYLGSQVLAVRNVNGKAGLRFCTYHPGIKITSPWVGAKYTYYFNSNHIISDVSASADFAVSLGSFSADGFYVCSNIGLNSDQEGKITAFVENIENVNVVNAKHTDVQVYVTDVLGGFADDFMDLFLGPLSSTLIDSVANAVKSAINQYVVTKLTSVNNTIDSEIKQHSVTQAFGDLKGREIASVSLDRILKSVNGGFGATTANKFTSDKNATRQFLTNICNALPSMAYNLKITTNVNTTLVSKCMESTRNAKIEIMLPEIDELSRTTGCYNRPIMISDFRHWNERVPASVRETCQINLKLKVTGVGGFEKLLLSTIAESGMGVIQNVSATGLAPDVKVFVQNSFARKLPELKTYINQML